MVVVFMAIIFTILILMITLMIIPVNCHSTTNNIAKRIIITIKQTKPSNALKAAVGMQSTSLLVLIVCSANTTITH